MTATLKTTVIKDPSASVDNITLDASGNVTAGAGATVTGATTLSSTLGVTGATTLSSTLGVTGATTLSSTLGVTGATTLSSTLGVTGDASFGSSITETIYAVSGTTPALDPANGTVQTWTLSANSTPTDSLAAGESMTLMVDDGTAYTITWPTMTWVNNGGSAPTLATSGYTVVALWKVSTTLYGALVGDGT